MQEAIKIDSVFLSFGTAEILRGVTLAFTRHQVTGILGRNGSGKSCLLKIITGQLRPQDKHISYQGQTIKDLYKIKGLINYLPQHEFHPASLTLSKLLRFYDINQDYFIGQYPFLASCLPSKFWAISGGERRIIEVLLVLESQSKFTILDEPFTHVMPKYVELIKKRINELKTTKGILITDHQYQNVLDVSDTTYLLAGGTSRKIVAIDDLRAYGYIR